MFAADIRRRRVSCMRSFRHWRWHLDEMFVKAKGERLGFGLIPRISRRLCYLWRAVDHEGEILEFYSAEK